jgi:hypothetical protein
MMQLHQRAAPACMHFRMECKFRPFNLSELPKLANFYIGGYGIAARDVVSIY